MLPPDGVPAVGMKINNNVHPRGLDLIDGIGQSFVDELPLLALEDNKWRGINRESNRIETRLL